MHCLELCQIPPITDYISTHILLTPPLSAHSLLYLYQLQITYFKGARIDFVLIFTCRNYVEHDKTRLENCMMSDSP